jgi:hypothetical protein
MTEPTCGREADGAAFARAHDRSPFRARCERRDGGVGGRGSDHHARPSRQIHFFPTLDRIHCPEDEIKVIARRFFPIADHFQLSSG